MVATYGSNNTGGRDWRAFVRLYAPVPLSDAAVDEMAEHLRETYEAACAEGQSEDVALVLARAQLANGPRRLPSGMLEPSVVFRRAWIRRWASDLSQDLGYTVRGLRRDRAFAVFAILITALGIGASTVVFSVVNALLLRPLPLREPDRLVWVPNEAWSTQVANFIDLRDRSPSVSGLAGWFGGYGDGDWQLTGAGEAERITGVPVTQNFFALLGVSPVLGRAFTEAESRQPVGAPSAVVLSHHVWQRRFGANPSVLGTTLTLNDRPVTVVGVLPASFDFAALFAPGTAVDVFVPWPLTDETNRRGNTMSIVGRLNLGVTVQGAQAELAALAGQLQREHPERNPVAPRVVTLAQHVNGRARPALLALAYAVGVVMMIVCANLSSLQLARLGARQREMAMRSALGAGRLRLFRQMLTESVVLSSCGAVLGLALAAAGTRAISRLDAFTLPLLTSVRVDGRALAFTALAAVLCGVLFGILPALHAPAADVRSTLQASGRGISGGGRRAWVRQLLVVSEVTLASALLVGAGLVLRSLIRVLDVDLGFEPAHTAIVRVDPGVRFARLEEQNVYLDEMLPRVRSVRGVAAAGVIDVLPFERDRAWQVSGKGQVYPKGQHPEAFVRVVSDGYFDAAGIRLRAGRAFTDRDRPSSERVVIVNETLARTLWPGQDPIGQMMTQDGGRRVIGVVGDVRHTALETAGGSENLPLRQTGDYPAMQLVVRTTLAPPALAAELRSAFQRIERHPPTTAMRSLQDLVDTALSPRRFLVLLLGGFAGFALLLASLGVYAVVSSAVQQRAQEFGIRLALGASPAGLRYHVFVRTLGLAGSGLLLGAGAARALSGSLRSLLFGVTTEDPLTYVVAGILLIAVAAAAGSIPAWRASRIDPMSALRAN